VNVLPGAKRGELVAVTESLAGIMRVDADSLRTLGPVKYTDGVKGDLTTAHPTLQRDGSLINLAIGVRHTCGSLPEVAYF
jgi:carlactone synthase/all-trans-10'-apo-beta-carotenal 13,14-cleaving dioxygenase